MSDEIRQTSEGPAPEVTETEPRYERTDRAAQKRSKLVRLLVLIAGLIIVTGIGIMHQLGPIKVVGVDALCPFGGIETLWSLMTAGTLVTKIAVSSVILLVTVLIVAFVFRRSFCGYICPLGALQELFGKIGKAIWGKKPRPVVPAAIDKWARYLKYVVLAVFTIWTWQAATLVIRPYDPWVAYMHLSSAEVFAEFSIGLAVLGVSLAGSIVYERFFCKYLCPMGGFLGAISPLSLFKVRRNVDSCIDCKACDKACPVNIKVSEVETVKSPECINCNECVNSCPVAHTLEVSTKPAENKPGKTLSPQAVLGWVGGIIAALLVATSVTGAFAWTMPTLAAAPAEGAPEFNVEEIKGSMTMAEVSAATRIPAQAFQDDWGIAPAEMGQKIKDLAEKYGFDVHTDFRDWVQLKLDQMKAGVAPAGGAVGATGSPAATGTGESGD